MAVLIRRWLVAGAVVMVACYRPELESCSIACTAASGCPRGTACSNGWCAPAGSTCAPVDAAIDAALVETCAPAAPACPLCPCQARVAGGYWHTCAIDVYNRLRCWGDDYHSQLGRVVGGTIASHEPQPPAELESPVTAVALGARHTCAIRASSLWCWGANDRGQLGVPFTSGGVPQLGPDLGAVISVAAGASHGCALVTDKSVWCWGDDLYGQVGDGGTGADVYPAAPVLDQATAVVAGSYHTCAIRDGVVWCWGWNPQGHLGAGTHEFEPAPVTVDGIDDVVELAAGEDHTCARRGDGTIWCWGSNVHGQLGDGTITDRRSPTRVHLDAAATALVAGGRHTCAIAAGRLWCWGKSSSGQIDGVLRDDGVREPIVVPGVCSPSTVGAGYDHTCASSSAGLQCWGSNSNYQLASEDQGTSGAVQVSLSCDAP